MWSKHVDYTYPLAATLENCDLSSNYLPVFQSAGCTVCFVTATNMKLLIFIVELFFAYHTFKKMQFIDILP